ncbi:hypothetical protein AND_007347 [Anopheles darlingi]|uniref:Uncharacterized protein n=1 Tax=Anopheles darlingi TaxID=43151 RepID=W5J983_ANODA|nr:hypothetical protein AND_007347 [Anopheles darlingi]
MANFKMFINKNLVAIVMIPSLIGMHWAWDNLQHNRALVADHERKDLPIVIAAKALWTRVGNQSEPASEK